MKSASPCGCTLHFFCLIEKKNSAWKPPDVLHYSPLSSRLFPVSRGPFDSVSHIFEILVSFFVRQWVVSWHPAPKTKSFVVPTEEPPLTLLVTCVLFLQWQLVTSAARRKGLFKGLTGKFSDTNESLDKCLAGELGRSTAYVFIKKHANGAQLKDK